MQIRYPALTLSSHSKLPNCQHGAFPWIEPADLNPLNWARLGLTYLGQKKCIKQHHRHKTASHSFPFGVPNRPNFVYSIYDLCLYFECVLYHLLVTGLQYLSRHRDASGDSNQQSMSSSDWFSATDYRAAGLAPSASQNWQSQIGWRRRPVRTAELNTNLNSRPRTQAHLLQPQQLLNGTCQTFTFSVGNRPSPVFTSNSHGLS